MPNDYENLGDFPSMNENHSINGYNLQKDLDNYPELSEIIKDDDKNFNKTTKLHINFGEDSEKQVKHLKKL